MREIPILRRAKAAEAQELRQKALEPQERYCYIQKMPVNILVEYLDYKGPQSKGPEGAIYCENILDCYQKNVRCRYSGISPLFDDPFLPRGDEEEEEKEPDGESQEESQEDAPEQPSEPQE
jgi:hypothetical protein